MVVNGWSPIQHSSKSTTSSKSNQPKSTFTTNVTGSYKTTTFENNTDSVQSPRKSDKMLSQTNYPHRSINDNFTHTVILRYQISHATGYI
jgi:hypothetical protein